MTRTAVSVQNLSKYAGLDAALTAVDASNGNSVVNNGNTAVIVQNGSGGSITATAVSVADPATNRTGDIALSIAAGDLGVFNFLPANLFNQSDGTVTINYSSGTSVKIAAINFKQSF